MVVVELTSRKRDTRKSEDRGVDWYERQHPTQKTAKRLGRPWGIVFKYHRTPNFPDKRIIPSGFVVRMTPIGFIIGP